MQQSQKLVKKINTYALIGGGGISAMLIQRLLDGSLYLSVLLSCAIAFVLGARTLTHLNRNLTVASHFIAIGAYIALSGAQLQDGGKDSMSLWLISIVPLIAGDLLGHTRILGYFLLSVLGISAPWIAEFFGWRYPAPIPLSDAEIVFMRVIGAIVVTAVCLHVSKEYDVFVVELAQKRAQVFKTHNQAQSLNQEKTSFLRQMSREIRAPLNGIKGMTQVWVRQDLDEETAEAVGTMDRCADNLLSIINDAQDLSRVGEHQFEICIRPFCISRMVDDVAMLFRGKAREKHIDLVAHGSSEDSIGLGDEKRLTQVLSNLVGNAIKFSDRGLVELRWRWTDHGVKFEVRDEGIGMSKSQVDSLFTEFTQVHEEESLRRGGTGLGLTISKSLVEAMGGTMKVESEAGCGSCFRVELPMARSDHATLQAQTEQEAQVVQLDAHVLVLDDDLASLWVQRLALENMGCRVDCTKTAASALELLQQKPFDLAIIDLRMPDTNGIEALSLLRSELGPDRSFPAIALTASAEPEDRQACLEAGFAEVLVKPFDYKVLQRAVSQYSVKDAGSDQMEQAS